MQDHQPESALDMDTALSLLSNRDRRQLLDLLDRQPGTDPLATERIMEETELAYPSLYHNHLPTLEAFQVIDWDQNADVVTRGAEFEDLRPLLRYVTQAGQRE